MIWSEYGAAILSVIHHPNNTKAHLNGGSSIDNNQQIYGSEVCT